MSHPLLILITLLPALLWFGLWRLQDQEREPWKAMLTCFSLGMLATLPFMTIAQLFPSWGMASASIGFTLLFASLEELSKALLTILGIEIHRQWFTQIVDGLIYGATVGLGFAFAENLFYWLQVTSTGGGFLGIYLVRSLNTMVAHSLFSAFFGFFYASAYLRKEIFPEQKKEKPWSHFFLNLWESLPLHVTLFHILPNRPSKRGHFPGSLICEGFLLAALLHFLFNGLIQWSWSGSDWSFLTIPLVALLTYLAWRMFFQEVYVRIVKVVKR